MTEFDSEGPDAEKRVDEHLHRAITELGDPDILFRVSPARFVTKLAVGIVLVVFGLVANYWWWVRGPAKFGHIELLVLVMLPLTGVALLWHMYRNRGLHVLVYPTGLLRLRRGEIDSFPWADTHSIRLKVQRATTAMIQRDEHGNPVACALPADVPTFKLWDGGLTLAREDGVTAQFGPALSEYPKLADEIQKRTFAVLWPGLWERFRAGQAIAFDDLELTPTGLRFAKKFLAWKDFKELTIAQNKLSIKQNWRWLPWYLKDASTVPNPHLLFALVEEARRQHVVLAAELHPQHPVADHSKS
jgi:hypothetical protein